MNKISSHFVAFAVMAGCACSSAVTIDVYLLGGQSNASGRGVKNQFAPCYLEFYESFRGARAIPEDQRILGVGRSDAGPIKLGYTGFGMCDGGNGPEIAAGYVLNEWYQKDPALKGRRICIIKHTKGGTSLSGGWKPNGTLSMDGDGPNFRLFQETVSGGLQRLRDAYPTDTIRIAGMMWHQGESDAGAGVSTQDYQKLMVQLIGEVRAKYTSGKAFPFVIGLLSKDGRMTHERIVEAQKEAARLTANVRAISTDGFEMNPDKLHYSAKGQESLGKAFAEALIQMGCTKSDSPWVKSEYQEPLRPSVHLSFDQNLETGSQAVYAGEAKYSKEKKFGAASLLLDGSYVLETKDFNVVSRGSGIPHTMAFWFKRADKDQSSQIIGRKQQDRQPTTRTWYIEITNDERLNWLSYPDGAKLRSASFANLPVDDTGWHHYVFMACDHDGDGAVNNMVLYVDGKLLGTTGKQNITTGFAAEAIGGDSAFPAERAKGLLDEFWLIPAALTADQIQGLYKNNTLQ